MHTEDSAELLTRAAKGDTDAFLKLFEAHYQAIYRFAYRLTNAVETAEDVTHYYLEGKITFPFQARCVTTKAV